MAAIAEKLKAASIDFRRPCTVGNVHQTPRAIATISQGQINHPPSQPENSTQAVGESFVQYDVRAFSAFIESTQQTYVGHLILLPQTPPLPQNTVQCDHLPAHGAPCPSHHMLHHTYHSQHFSLRHPAGQTASAAHDQALKKIRWNQTLDSTTVSGFSNLSRQPPAELGQLALLTAPESRSEMGREESEEREKGDNSLRRFRKMKRERRPILAGMLKAILRQRSEDKIAVADERDISKPASRHKLNPA